jgi:uncharacterized protein YjdB
MKKSLFFGIFLGVVVSLVLIGVVLSGCPTDGGGSSKVKVTGVKLSASDGSTGGDSVVYLNGNDVSTPKFVVLTATVEPANAANKKVSWLVTPDTFVEWDAATGMVTAKALGGPTTVRVTTADGKKTAEWTITVASPESRIPVTGVEITTPGSLSFTKSGNTFSPASVTLVYTVSPENATNKAVSWSVEPAGIVTVENGVVTPVGTGSAVITLASVDVPAKKDTINVSVTDGSGPNVSVTGITLDTSVGGSGSSTIYLGGTSSSTPASVTFSAVVEPSNATNKNVTWTVEPGTYVTWNEATHTATAKALGGPTTVTVKTADGNFTKSHTITVANPASHVAVTEVNITTEVPLKFNKSGSVFDPETIQLEWTVSPENATNKAIDWTVEPAGIVTVTDGLVTPVTTGNTVITWKSNDNHEITGTINVSVIDPAQNVPVTGVEITTPGPLNFTKSGSVFAPETIQLEWTVNPSNASNSGVSWSSSDTNVATVLNGLVTPVAIGNAVITVTTDDGSKTDTIDVSVTEGGTQPTEYELKLYNMGTVAAGTTTELSRDPATNKYTVKNASSTGAITSGTAGGTGNPPTGGVVAATIVYLNKPFTGNSVSVSARVRIKASDSAASGTKGVLMGLVGDPTAADIPFMGIRGTTNAYWRAYHSRSNNTNTSTLLTAATNSGYGESPGGTNGVAPSLIDSVPIPFDEEFIYEYERTGATAYAVRLKDYAGNLLASATQSSSNISLITAEKPGYLGFIIADAEVEISGITMKEGTDTLFTSPASTPTPTPVASVEFTAPAGIDNGTYNHSTSASTTLVIGAKALPARAPASSNINWTVTGPATLSANTGTSLTATFSDTTGNVVVTASTGGKSAELAITLVAGAISVSDITISPLSGSIMAGKGSIAGETLQFSAEVGPSNAANKAVTWSVAAAADGTGTASAATINSTSGLLTAASDLSSDGTVYVFATAADGSGTKSAGTAITVKKFTMGISISAAGNKTSIMAGNGTVAGETLQFSATITPPSASGEAVTWSVWGDANGTVDVSSVATISNGLLTASSADISADTKVYVFAAVTSDPTVKTAGTEITVKKYAAPPAISLVKKAFGTGTGNAVYTSGKLTVTGTGAIASGTPAGFYIVYVNKPISGDVFDAEVDILLGESSFGIAHNNTKVGLIAIKGDPATHTTASIVYYLNAHYGTSIL